MKKIIPCLVIGMFVFYGLGAVANTNDLEENTSEAIEIENGKALDFTHAVFAEFGTATWCGYCKYAHAALKSIYASGDYPFYYVSLVTDKNSDAQARVNQYNIYGYPTVWFDGGYRVVVGGYSGTEGECRTAITACSTRAVEDVDIDLDVTWMGGTEMQIQATVTNNEASTYGGHIRVYITEISSSMNWHDTGGYLYTFPLLDYAFNEPLTIPVGGYWSDTITWDGTSNGFPSVTQDNLMVIAAVFNDEWNQGYSYPPSQNPFDAYYVDESTAIRVGNNQPPNTPSDPNPVDGQTNIGLETDIRWTGDDPDWFDILTYDVYFGAENPPPLVDTVDEEEYDPGTLDHLTTYYWQIVTWDPYGESAEGPIWSFTTREPGPDLDCDGDLNWEELGYGEIVTGEITVENIGESESVLNWEISEYPDWGTWSFNPESGTGLTPEEGAITIEVEITAPEESEEGEIFEGEIKLVNTETSSDYCIVGVSMTNSINQHSVIYHFLEILVQRFPILAQILALLF